MAFSIVPKNKVGELEYPNGFWCALMVETPVSRIIGAEYTERDTIKYDHEGFVGEAWFTEAESLEMHRVLTEFLGTKEYAKHRYFSDRKDQMEKFMAFLPVCGGFTKY